jgi:CIC family chloride channel protein
MSEPAAPGLRWGRMILLSAGVGVLAGLAAAGLKFGLHHAVPHLAGAYATTDATLFRFHWMILLLPVLGGLFSGLLITILCRPGGTHGTEAFVRAFHYEGGEMGLKDASVRAVAAVGVIGCGGSVGPEGPIAALGAAIGSTVAKLLKLDAREKRTFLLAGCAAGVGAIFQCPLGGALFATTILYRVPEIYAEALMPSIVASVIGYSTYMAFWGYGHPLLADTGTLAFSHPAHLLAYAVLALFCALATMLLHYAYFGIARLNWKKRVPAWLTPAIGGLVVGGIALAVPQVMDARYEFIQNVLTKELFDPTRHSWLTWAGLAGLVVVTKCLATGVTVGSGNAGGLLGPSVFIGGAVGAFTGAFLDSFFIIHNDLRAALIPVGMAGLLAAAMRTPLAAIVMVTEMTGSYGLIVPLMFVSVVSYLAGRRWGLNEEQISSTAASPAHAGESLVSLLESLRVDKIAVRDWPHTVAPGVTLPELVSKLPAGATPTFAVVAEGRLIGTVTAAEIAQAMQVGGALQIIIAADIMTPSPPSVRPDADIYATLDLFRQHARDTLPVMDEDGKFVGMLTRTAIAQTLKDHAAAQRTQLLREHTRIRLLDEEGKLQSMLADLPADKRVERMPVPADVVGKSLRESDFRKRYGFEVVSIQMASGQLQSPPDPNRPLAADDALVVMKA